MSAPLLQKKFRFELEFNVSIDEVSAEHLNPNSTTETLPYLRALQSALLQDQPALLQLIQARLVSSLQGYTDNLAGEDALAGLRRVEASLEGEGKGETEGCSMDLGLLTRPLRISTLGACLSSSTLSEEQGDGEGATHWQPVWEDLRPQSPLGKWINLSAGQGGFAGEAPDLLSGHHFLLRYLDRQMDGIHAEAACRCGLRFHGSGPDEGQALQAAWEGYRRHLEAYGVGTDPTSQEVISRL